MTGRARPQRGQKKIRAAANAGGNAPPGERAPTVGGPGGRVQGLKSPAIHPPRLCLCSSGDATRFHACAVGSHPYMCRRWQTVEVVSARRQLARKTKRLPLLRRSSHSAGAGRHRKRTPPGTGRASLRRRRTIAITDAITACEVTPGRTERLRVARPGAVARPGLSRLNWTDS